jgi:hypothetical protein
MSDLPELSFASAPVKSSNLPPLRIHHILVATAVTAVYLSFAQALKQNDIGGFSSFVASGTGLMYAISTPLAVTAVGFGLYWKLRGIRFFHQPGHWLLVTQAFEVWIILLAALALINRSAAEGILLGRFVGLFFFVLDLAVIAIDLWAAWRVADTSWWRLMFVFKALMILDMFAIQFVLRTSPHLYAYANLATDMLVFALLVSAACADRLSRRQRDWPHWFGVFTSVAVYAVAILPQLFALVALAVST